MSNKAKKNKNVKIVAMKASSIIITLMMKVFKNPKEAKEFMETFEAMMKDEFYIADKMVEMPGRFPEAEEELRRISKIILGRRI